MRNIALMLALAATPAAAQVARFEMEAPMPTYGGASFGTTGAYELLRGRATIALDPADPRNAVIADIALAPRNAEGRVEAVTDVLILRPTDPARGNGTLLVEPPNRGRQIIGQLLNDAPGASNGRYATAADAGNGWMFRQGYTIAWIGWQGDPTPGAGMRVRVPRVPNVTGAVRDEFVFDNTTNPGTGQLTYEPADSASLRVTVRARTEDARATPAGLAVAFTAPDRISITRPAGFDAGAIYEVTYTARDPGVMGMGFAAFRDVSAALRHGEAPGNPQAGRASARAVTLGVSQSGRFLRDALYLGFNEDTAGRAVFEGMVPHIPGSRRTDTNARWAQPGRNPSDHTDRLYPADQFPFTYADTTDPLSGVTDGLLRRCTERRNCPRILQTDSEFEYWGARGSLTVTDAAGGSIALPANVRAYMYAGHPHYASAEAWVAPTPVCAMPVNTLQAGAPARALMVALEAWIREGVEPPASRTPSVADGTLRSSGALAQLAALRIHGLPVAGPSASFAFPAIPG
ncbi:MAG: alpha/beta hydrolase domain-containing protein, partial [Roseococcus sp.]